MLAIFFPIMAFVAMGFDHVVANMSSCPSATSSAPPGWAGAGCVNNLVRRSSATSWAPRCSSSGFYWFLHLRGTPEPVSAGASADAEPGHLEQRWTCGERRPASLSHLVAAERAVGHAAMLRPTVRSSASRAPSWRPRIAASSARSAGVR